MEDKNQSTDFFTYVREESEYRSIINVSFFSCFSEIFQYENVQVGTSR